MDQMKKLNVDDWVRIAKVGVDGSYRIIEILEEHVYRGARAPVAELVYECEQNDEGYKHRVRCSAEELIKL